MKNNTKRPLYIPYAGPTLLETPLLNKGSAFTKQERSNFNLAGLLPPRYETIDEQVERAYMQYSTFSHSLNKHIYLRAIHDNNETLFFRLVQAHLTEMMPIIIRRQLATLASNFQTSTVVREVCLFLMKKDITLMQYYAMRLKIKSKLLL